MIELNELDKGSILQPAVYVELFKIEDFIERESRRNEIIIRGKELGVLKHVENTMKRFEKDHKRQETERIRKEMRQSENITEFSDDSLGNGYQPMYCGSWVANDNGIFLLDSEMLGATACYHPILPVKRYRNMEDGKEQITIAFKRDRSWSELTVPKGMIAKASTIVDLAEYGIAVTSENAKLLVKYLMDVENCNSDVIQVTQSTSKLGWRKNKITDNYEFLPYDSENIFFDGESKFPGLCESISQEGDFSEWIDHMKGLREKGYIEPRMALAASFASVLVKLIDAQSFVVDFWGSTEGGKTVCLMVACSVWADPSESRYIGNFKSTSVSLETKCDLLNSFPLILDDSSNASRSVREGFEELVYSLCSGKGKSRSNKSLGQERERFWHNVTICNGERPLSGYTEQGGAFNRIIEVECSDKIFDDPRKTADVVKRNFGYPGLFFTNCLKKYDKEELFKIFKTYERQLQNYDGLMQKQINAMSAILAADQIATEFIFKDGKNLRVNDVRKFLVDRQTISEGLKCYQYLMDTVKMKGQHFDEQSQNIDQWGEIEVKDDVKYVYFYITAFETILEQGGFYRNQFTSWAKKEKLLRYENNRDTFRHRFRAEKTLTRTICVIINESLAQNDDEEDDFN